MKNFHFEHIDTKRFRIGFFPCADMKGDEKNLMVQAGCNEGNVLLRTADGGDTWDVSSDDKHRGSFLHLADGSYISFGYHSVVEHCFDPEVQEKIPFVLKILRAPDYESLVAGRIQTEFNVVDIPDLSIGYGDSGDRNDYYTGAVDHGGIQLDNGDIIITVYGQFKSDKSKLDYFTNYDFYQYRTWCLISRDNGHTFEFLSTIADCQTYPIPDAEGYCEPSLLNLGGEHILCVLRTQGHEVYTPMFFTHSTDSGKTWSKPEVLNPYGVLPRLIKTENGAVVCSSGKWDTFLLVSGDDGYTWSKPHVVAENDGQWDRGPSGYTSLFEAEPNTVVLVYDTTEDKYSDNIKSGERRIIYASRFKVVED